MGCQSVCVFSLGGVRLYASDIQLETTTRGKGDSDSISLLIAEYFHYRLAGTGFVGSSRDNDLDLKRIVGVQLRQIGEVERTIGRPKHGRR